MNEMVERVARAIHAAEQAWETQPRGMETPEFFEAMARAAIEAMRVPTPDMTKAAENPGDESGYGKITDSDAEIVWDYMIDAALKD